LFSIRFFFQSDPIVFDRRSTWDMLVPLITMDHFLVTRIPEHHHRQRNRPQRSLVIYQHPPRSSIPIRSQLGHRPQQQPPTSLHPLTPPLRRQYLQVERFFDPFDTIHRPRLLLSSSSSSSSGATNTWLLARAEPTTTTTTLIRRSRRDLQPYPPPIIIVIQLAHHPEEKVVVMLPDEVWYRIGQYCDVPDLYHLRQCHPKLRRLLSHNAAGWKNQCRLLWRGRYHVCPAAVAMVQAMPSNDDDNDESNRGRERRRRQTHAPSLSQQRKQQKDDEARNHLRAYEMSVRDAVRETLTDDELCATIWWFRFKESAGQDWIRDDPWHRGGDAVRMVFLRDGRVVNVPAPTTTNNHNNAAQLLAGLVISWQWIECPALLDDNATITTHRGRGAYLRLTVSGRDVPTYIVRRFAPNWGFIMENCWGVFASFELPPKKMMPTTMGLLLQLTTGPASSPPHQHLHPRDDPPDDVGGGPPRKRPRPTTTTTTGGKKVTIDDLTTECYFIVNGQNQWREAFLYNIGARHIPHGPNAMEAFRHACEAAFLHNANHNTSER
jgi:hypothetical protein